MACCGVWTLATQATVNDHFSYQMNWGLEYGNYVIFLQPQRSLVIMGLVLKTTVLRLFVSVFFFMMNWIRLGYCL